MIEAGENRIRLQAREVLRFKRSPGVRLAAVDGVVWITVERDPRDILLQPGEAYRVLSDRPVHVGPLFGAVTLAIRGAECPATGAAGRGWGPMARIRALTGPNCCARRG